MADRGDQPPNTGRRHLDATGPEEVVFCHQCEHEWIRGQDGSLQCPVCEGKVTEIVSPESDPRHFDDPLPQELRGLHYHNPWADGEFPDPDEEDIEEAIHHGPEGTTFSRTRRFGGMQPGDGDGNDFPGNDPDHVLRDFQTMVGNMVGPGFRAGQPGRSGPETLFTPGSGNGSTFTWTSGGMGGQPRVVGARYTWTSGEDGHFHSTTAGQPADLDLGGLLNGLFSGPMGGARGGGGGAAAGGMPPGLLGLLSMMNPQNARSGDAVYSQEALDSIISQLMEQQPTSNAPGPASADDIAKLPKKKLDHEMLGPEGKGECSVCMDDVHIGEEVVVLPCHHWFHEACASAWLREHNTCPICRKGINDISKPTSDGRDPGSSATPAPQDQPHPYRSGTSSSSSRRFGLGRRESSRDFPDSSTSRNESRLNSIRNTSRQASSDGSSSSRWNFGGISSDNTANDPDMPGSFQRRETSNSPRVPPRPDTSESSQAGGGSGSGSGFSWLRNRFGSDRRSS